MSYKHITLTSSMAALLLVSGPAVHAQHAGGSKDTIIQPGPSPATDDEWRFSITPYFWLPSVSLDVTMPSVTVGRHTLGGTTTIDQSFWDTASHPDSNSYICSANGRFEAWKGAWGGFIDGYWMFGKTTINRGDAKMVLRDRLDLTTSSSIVDRFNTGQVNFGPQYLLGKAPLGTNSCVDFIVYGGGRVNWIGNDLSGTVSATATAVPGSATETFDFSTSNSRVFVEPMIGMKTIWKLGDSWFATLRGDVAGFGWVANNNWDCDLEASINWEFTHGVYLDLGYRARGQWEDGGGANSNLSAEGWFYGPELGMTWKF
jgi:hypothetical protein